MRIVKIAVYQADLPLVDRSYEWAEGKRVTCYDSTVVALHTDEEAVVGYGEVVPLGSNYLPSFARGVRAGLEELAPRILGADPTEVGAVNARMDYNLKGHPYVKSAVDMACWDILGKVCNKSVATLLGGRLQETVRMYRAIPQRSAQEMADLVQKYREQGYKRFQLKLGGTVDDDIARIKACRRALAPDEVLIGDANTGWKTHEALRVARAVQDLDVYLEQPCPTIEECGVVRKATSLPMVIDENVTDLHSLLEAWQRGTADVVNIKISKLGGLTKAKKAIDFCSEVGLAMTIEDTWGGDIGTAAILQLAATAPERLQFSATDFNAYNSTRTGVIRYKGDGSISEGRMEVPNGPGLNVVPNMKALGKPIKTYE